VVVDRLIGLRVVRLSRLIVGSSLVDIWKVDKTEIS
jgi:hypothetical protein